MPRFFFDLNDAADQHDDTGAELPDLPSAEHDAIRLLGEIIRYEPQRLIERALRVTIREGETEEVSAVTASVERLHAPS